MRLETSKLQKIKMALHSVQAILVFIAACLTIAVLSKSKKTDGRIGWFFAMVRTMMRSSSRRAQLTDPVLPHHSGLDLPGCRSHVVALAKIRQSLRLRCHRCPIRGTPDVSKSWVTFLTFLFKILWLSAFAAVAGWHRQGLLQGATDHKIDQDQANCTVFAYGPETACHDGYATIFFGVVTFLLFVGAAIISYMYVQKVRKDPAADDPWLAKGGSGQPYAIAGGGERGDGATSKDPIWDHDTHDIDNPFPHDDHNHDDAGTERGGDQADDEYSLLNSTETDEGRHPGHEVPWGSTTPLHMPSVDTEYRGAHGYHAPSALSPGGRPSPASPDTLPAYEEFQGRGTGRGGNGYSFSQPAGR
jgi:hypothetical protein